MIQIQTGGGFKKVIDGQSFISTGMAAQRLGVCPKTIVRWLDTGKLNLKWFLDPINKRNRWIDETSVETVCTSLGLTQSTDPKPQPQLQLHHQQALREVALTTSETAQLLGVSTRTIIRWVEQGRHGLVWFKDPANDRNRWIMRDSIQQLQVRFQSVITK